LLCGYNLHIKPSAQGGNELCCSRISLKELSCEFLAGRYYAQIIHAGKLEASPFFFLNFKGTPSQEEHKTIFSGLTICKVALYDQSDFPAIFRLHEIA
jgi:hypothetical protein